MTSTKRRDGKTEMSRPKTLSEPPGPRWWKRRRTWFVGLPVALILVVVGAFAWGSLQPKPQGFAVADPGKAVPATADADASASSAQPEVAAAVEEPAPPAVEAVRYTLDARSNEDWVFFDFVEGQVIESDFSAAEWDVAFRRTKMLTNSGVTNPTGPGGALDLGEIPLEEASPAAGVSFVVDSLGGEDSDEPENAAAGKWYTYSFISHIVSVKPNTYLIRTGEDLDALVQFDSYYCEDEESGCITFRYRLVPGQRR